MCDYKLFNVHYHLPLACILPRNFPFRVTLCFPGKPLRVCVCSCSYRFRAGWQEVGCRSILLSGVKHDESVVRAHTHTHTFTHTLTHRQLRHALMYATFSSPRRGYLCRHACNIAWQADRQTARQTDSQTAGCAAIESSSKSYQN